MRHAATRTLLVAALASTAIAGCGSTAASTLPADLYHTCVVNVEMAQGHSLVIPPLSIDAAAVLAACGPTR